MLNKICTDLDTSKKLREIGVKKLAYFSWHGSFQEGEMIYKLTKHEFNNNDDNYLESNNASAYTLEEILEMLPERIRLKSDSYPDRYFYYSLKLDMHLMKLYYNCSGELKYETEIENEDENLATTAGKLLIKLKEDKII